MRHLIAKVEELTGISEEEAREIDEHDFYNILGEETIKCLSQNFYTRVFGDSKLWFRNIFKHKDFQDAVLNQHNFFIQRLGGPSYYTIRKGPPALIARHLRFNMGRKATERWLLHMKAALAETKGISPRHAKILIKYFTHTAYLLSLGVKEARKTGR